MAAAACPTAVVVAAAEAQEKRTDPHFLSRRRVIPDCKDHVGRNRVGVAGCRGAVCVRTHDRLTAPFGVLLL